MKLYSYWRSSSAYRVRIALELKGLRVEQVTLALLEHKQDAPEYAALNPMQQVPTLVLDDGTALTQSLAIIEYLDEAHPRPPLLPSNLVARGRARAMAHLIASGIQPLQNLSLLRYLEHDLGVQEPKRLAIRANVRGLVALEALAEMAPASPFLGGAQPGLADVCLVPQIYSARRFGVDLSQFPRLSAAHGACEALDAFARAHPDRQPDAIPA
jgi:maleylpyruvate isomerase